MSLCVGASKNASELGAPEAHCPTPLSYVNGTLLLSPHLTRSSLSLAPVDDPKPESTAGTNTWARAVASLPEDSSVAGHNPRKRPLEESSNAGPPPSRPFFRKEVSLSHAVRCLPVLTAINI